jgi:hypothetical protein
MLIVKLDMVRSWQDLTKSSQVPGTKQVRPAMNSSRRCPDAIDPHAGAAAPENISGRDYLLAQVGCSIQGGKRALH